MKQATGAKSKLVIGFESAFGILATTGYNMPFNSSGVKGQRNQTTPSTIRGNLNPMEPFDGNTSVAGQIVVPVDSIAFWYWLKAMFGDPTTSGTGPFDHEFKAGDDSRGSISIEHQFLDLDTPQYFQYTGCKINSCAISTGGDGELVATLDVVGAKETIATSPMDSSQTDVSFARLKNNAATLKEGGSAINNAKVADFTISWNCDTDQYVIGGGGVLGFIPDGVMSVSGNLDALFEDVTLLNKALNSTESSLEVTYSAAADSSLVFKFPELKYSQNSPGIDGPQGVAVSLPWSAYYTDAIEAASVVATITNNEEHV